MSIDKFGRSLQSQKRSVRGPKGEGFNLTPEGDYDIQSKRLRYIGEPLSPHDAVNLETFNRKALTLGKNNNYDAKNNYINNLRGPEELKDAATKEYVDEAFKKELVTISTNIAKQVMDTNNLKERVSKCEGRIEDNKTYHEKNLKKFGVLLFNYINQKSTGRAATLPPAVEGDYLNWEELFKLPKPEIEAETDIELSLPDDVRDILREEYA